MTSPFTYRDVKHDLIDPLDLGGRVNAWKRRRRDTALIRWVLGFEHTVLPGVTPNDVHDVLQRSSHALGYLDKERDTEKFIADANPPWAMSYLYHGCMERQGGVPTWGEFYAYATGPAARKWWEPIRKSAQRNGVDQVQALRATTWRLATAWQSAIRTTHALAVLRYDHGLPVRYHLFAHTELRIDGWHGGHAFRLMMPSEYEYKKTDPRTILGGGIEIHDVVVKGYARGVVWLPSETSLRRLAETMRHEESPQLALMG